MTETGSRSRQAIGYRSPPTGSRFIKGRSGNPAGRPRGSKSKSAPYEAVLGQRVTVRDNGTETLMTAAEAFVLQLTKQGLGGDSAAARSAMHAIENALTRRATMHPESMNIVFVSVTPGSVNHGLVALRMGVVLDEYRDTANTRIEPWLVQLALARLGDRKLTLDEQIEVVISTRTPKKVQWPDWWEALPGSAALAAGRAARPHVPQKKSADFDL